jgi:multidrug efflux pump subunit AcrA (membrane-fusion protein)
LLAATPALADETNYNQNPTPAERAQTNSLNSTAADNARANTNANAAAQSDYDAARAAYERSLNDYRDRKSDYDNDRASYDAQRANYDRQREQRWSSFRDLDHYRDVLSLRQADLIGLAVTTRDGDRIGRIHDVDFGPDGKVRRLSIEVSWHHNAWVYADDVRYDPRNRALLIDLSRDQVDRLSRMREFGS